VHGEPASRQVYEELCHWLGQETGRSVTTRVGCGSFMQRTVNADTGHPVCRRRTKPMGMEANAAYKYYDWQENLNENVRRECPARVQGEGTMVTEAP